MSTETYEHCLRFLRLGRGASEQEVRSVLDAELRKWTRRVNAATLEARQEAERTVKMLDKMEKVLLGPEGQIARSRAGGCGDGDPGFIQVSVNAGAVAAAIERVAQSRGTKAQERQGTVLRRRAVFFYRGVDYSFEELIHKKYDADQDRRECTARAAGLVLFEWSGGIGKESSLERTGMYIPGPWAADVVSFAAECEHGQGESLDSECKGPA